jgi:23S rRNA pseudouridine1911/1915/1917 synthase
MPVPHPESRQDASYLVHEQPGTGSSSDLTVDQPMPAPDAGSEAGDEAGLEGIIVLRPEREHRNERLDKFVATHLPELSRAYIQRLIDEGFIRVDGVVRKRTFKVTPGELITVELPPPVDEEIVPEPIPLDIVYEDADIVVVNKPAGMVVHPAPGHAHGTLVNALLYHAPDMVMAGTLRPGIVHRLDKDTSGLIVIAKTDRARLMLLEQWQQRSVEKIYLALVRGNVDPDEATIDVPIGRDPRDRQRMAALASGRPAITHIRVLQRYRGATLLEAQPETGRTHQIRVHLAFIGHPIVGDAIYNPHTGPTGGRQAIVPRQFLHAARLSLTLPDGRRITFESALPHDLGEALRRLEPV